MISLTPRSQSDGAAGRKKFSARPSVDRRLSVIFFVIVFCFLAVGVRLFQLMILEHPLYTALANASHDDTSALFPKRGIVTLEDWRTRERYPVALNKDVYLLYADTREIPDDETAIQVGEKLAEMFLYADERKAAVIEQLKRRFDPYEPIEQTVEEELMQRVKELKLPGIDFVHRLDRFYPEGNLAAAVIGFVGKDTDGQTVGRYGIEGYWEADLAGSGGFLSGVRSRSGGWIPLAGLSFKPATPGADILLTIDRSLEHYACEKLRQAMEEFEAASASLIMADPVTGAIRAMCSIPDFDPNDYRSVDTVALYNNSTIFVPYEPGSIFKPITMAAAIDEGVIVPEDQFLDLGSRDGVCQKSIKNAGERSYGRQTMTGILQNSINTGMVSIVEKLGKKRFREYLQAFGMGIKLGIELDTEVSGTIESLSKNSDDHLDCYTATGAFGQGITVTPLQMVAAFGAIANGGNLMKPYIVEEIRYADGKVVRTKPRVIREVISRRAASLTAGMLVQVVDHGYGGRARVPGYFVGGKTGTAQIPGPGGYTEDTNHSFIGFAPVDNPKFVMLVKFEKPERNYAEITAAPVFSDIAAFALQYYQVPPER